MRECMDVCVYVCEIIVDVRKKKIMRRSNVDDKQEPYRQNDMVLNKEHTISLYLYVCSCVCVCV